MKMPGSGQLPLMRMPRCFPVCRSRVTLSMSCGWKCFENKNIWWVVKIFHLVRAGVGVGHHLAGPAGRPPVLLDPLAVDAEAQHGGHLAEGRANLRGNIVIVCEADLEVLMLSVR